MNRCPFLCHPEWSRRFGSATSLPRATTPSLSSRAKPRDLQFRGPLLETPQGRLNLRVVQIRFEKCLGSAPTLYEPLSSPFCHPERSRGICSSADHHWKCGIRCPKRILISSK